MSKFNKKSGGNFGGDWISARVKIKQDKKLIGVIPVLEDGEEDFKNVIEIPLKDAPENIFEGRHSVQLTEDRKGIAKFHPYSGQFIGKFVKFAGKQDELPAPKANTARKSGKTFYTFTPIFEIVDGPYKGTDAPYFLYYNFDEDSDGKAMLLGGGDSTKKVEEFLDYTIGLFDPPQWSANLLPLFQKMALRADRHVSLIFKKGFIDTLVELDQPAKKSKKADSEPPWTPDEE